MTIAEIQSKAAELRYTLSGTKKADLIASFLTAQEAAE